MAWEWIADPPSAGLQETLAELTSSSTPPSAVLRTSTPYITSRFRLRDFLSLKDFGGKCDGVSDDTAAWQAAGVELIARSGGRLYVPGPSLVLTTSPLISVPPNCPIWIEGTEDANERTTIMSGSSLIQAQTGSSGALLRWLGTGLAVRAYGGIKNLRIDGNNVAGVLGVVAERCNNHKLERVQIDRCLAGALTMTQHWNSMLDDVIFRGSGAAGGAPAVLIASLRDNTFNSGSNTLLMKLCQWENNIGPYLRVRGEADIGSSNVTCILVDFKMEGNTTSDSYLDIDYASNFQAAHGLIARTGAGAVPLPLVVMKHDASPLTTTNSNMLKDIQMVERRAAEVFVDITGTVSRANIADLSLDSTTVTVGGVRIGSTVPAGGIKRRDINTRGTGIGAASDLPLIVDARATASVASTAALKLPQDEELVSVTGTAAITSITAAGWNGRTVRLVFTGTAATTGLTAGSNLKIPANFVYTPNDTYTLVCDGTNWYAVGSSVNP